MLSLNGAWGHNKTSALEFRVYRCHDSDECENNLTKLDEFIKDIHV